MYPDSVKTELQKKVYDLTLKHGAATVLAMLVKAVETVNEAGYLDPPGTMPRAGNWCGPYTQLLLPVAKALGVNSWVNDFYDS